jgi:hypothetical protein
MPEEVVANDRLAVIQHKSLETFAIMVSRVFTVWNKAVSGRLESRLNLSVTITYNNFPFPKTSAAEGEKLDHCAQGVLEARAKFQENSLADLYDSNSMPPVLRQAHEKLDAVTLQIFGLKTSSTDEEILVVLFERHAAATKGLI